MKETSISSQVVIVLTEHPVLGILLIPYIAEQSPGRDELRLAEQAFHVSTENMKKMNDAERKAIDIASHYTERSLMEVYSHEKTLSQFLRKLTDNPGKVKEKIRPFIDKKLMEMVELIIQGGLPLYQKQSGSKLLYPHHSYRVNHQPVDTVFSFDINEHCFSYQLKCTCNEQELSLTEHKPVVVLTTNPATLLLGMNLYTFHHIEASRLLPFTKKRCVSVETTLIQKYIDNILIPIARYHEVDVQGLSLIEKKRPCEALLYIEENIYNEILLRLMFRYGDQTFTPEDAPGIKRFIQRQETETQTSIDYFSRDDVAEKRAIHLLTSTGFKQISDSHYQLSNTAPQKTITEWIAQYREMLQKDFLLLSALEEKPYCLDEIRIEQGYNDTPDWFELRIMVVIDEFKIPFSRFRKHILEENREYILPDGRIILLPDEWFSKYANLSELGEENDKVIRLKHSFVGVVQSLLIKDDEHKDTPLLPTPKELPPPKGLKAQLRNYQQKGFNWMMHLNEQHLGGCLADDMGLGKTLQTLALLQYVYNGRNTTAENDPSADSHDSTTDDNKPLIKLSPTENAETSSTIPISIDEMGQFCLFDTLEPENTLPGNSANGQQKTPVITNRKPGTLIVMPTSLLHNWKREAARFTTLSMAEYNAGSRFRKGHPELFFNRYHLIFTSYGMMRNNIDTLKQYCFEYVVLDESQNIKNSDSLTFRAAKQLCSNHRLVLTGTPIENSLKDLWSQFHFLQPDLLGDESTFNKRFIHSIRQGNTRTEVQLRQLISPFILRRSKKEVAPELPALTEEIIYCDMTDEQDTIYQQEKNSLRNVLLELKSSQEKHQSLTVLNGILRLRQLACHPQLICPDFTGTSGKLKQIIDTFETLQSEGHKVLIFSSFVKHLELIAAAFHQREWPYALLTGSSTNRPEEIARFNQTEEIQAFLISLKAGGVGLNLTQADYVFIIDPWWNPAAEAQAIARAHRIGQDKQVIAYRFITQDSIEEKILQLQEEKRKLAAAFITDSDTLPSLTGQEWANLLS